MRFTTSKENGLTYEDTSLHMPQYLTAKSDRPTTGCCNARAKPSYVADDPKASFHVFSTPASKILHSLF